MSKPNEFSLGTWANAPQEEFRIPESDYNELQELSKAFMKKARELGCPSAVIWQPRGTADGRYALSMDATVGEVERVSATMLLIQSLGAGATDLIAEAKTFHTAHSMKFSGGDAGQKIHELLAGIFGDVSGTKH